MKYLYQLGRQAPDLALAELTVLLHRNQGKYLEKISTELGIIELDDNRAATLFSESGGLIRLAKYVGPSSPQTCQIDCLNHLSKSKAQFFAITSLDGTSNLDLNLPSLKKELLRSGTKMNFKEASITGTAVLQQKNIVELVLVSYQKELSLWQTLAATDPSDWALRDVGKPVRERVRGMLAPKLARMLINIGLGHNDPDKVVILDPFVGTGTILMEALMLGSPLVLGSDYDEKAIVGSEKNINWLQESYQLAGKYELKPLAVHQLRIDTFSVRPHLIVTEPFLGRLNPSPKAIPGIIRGLEKLYKGTLKRFSEVLSPGGTVVMLLPKFGDNPSDTVKETWKNLRQPPWEWVAGPFNISRPDAITQRHAVVVKLQS